MNSLDTNILIYASNEDVPEYAKAQAGCQRCCFELEMWHWLERHLKSSRFEAKRTFDAVLAITLISNTVDVFYTRNTRDFRGFGFRSIVNPID
jgi:predicted nucleic acid-binding protein